MATAVQNLLVDALNRIPILEPEQMADLPRLHEAFPQPRALAKELLRREWLTAYQINQIFLGHAEDLVLGQYLCLNKIGEGGMGNVFKALQRRFQRIVALKVLRRECVEQGKALLRFQREIRAVGQMRHPNIVRAHDADEAGGLHYIAMEYIEGIDLARMVKRQGPLAIEPALDFVRQIALALQHAHDAGLIHRDVKPANILVAKETGATRKAHQRYRWGMVKLLDLGLARRSDPKEASLTAHGTVMGTPDFIAPEQALNPHTCDGRADLYSLGCTLYYLLTGRIPFPQGGVTEKLLHHQMHEAEPIAQVRRQRLMQESAKTGKRIDEEFYDVPANVDAVVRKLMAKRPEDRFQSGAEVARMIDHLIDSQPCDPMANTHTSTLTQPCITLPAITLAPLPASETMPAAELAQQLGKPGAPSSHWQSMVENKEHTPIVNVHMPTSDRRAMTRWWFVTALVTIILTTLLYFQGGRALRILADDADVKRVAK